MKAVLVYNRKTTLVLICQVDEEKYPEYYRKPLEYVKGSNYDVPESFKIGKLTPKTTVFAGADKWQGECAKEKFSRVMIFLPALLT